MKILEETLLYYKGFFINFIFYFFKVFGLATIDLTIKWTSKNRVSCICSCSKKGILFNIIIIIYITTINYIIHVHTRKNTQKMPIIDGKATCMNSFGFQFPCEVNFRNFEETIEKVHYGNQIFNSFAILIIFCFRQKRAIKIIGRIIEVRESLINLNSKIYNKCEVVSKNIAMIFLIIIVVWSLYVVSFPTANIIHILSCISSYSSIFIINSVLIQYSIILAIVRKLFQVLNDNINDIKMNPTLFSKISTVTKSSSQLKLDKLLNLRNLYSSLSAISHDLTKFYSPPMFLCTLNIFVSVQFAIYYILKPLILGNNNLPMYVYVHSLFYAITNVTSIIILSKSASETVAEVIHFLESLL